MKEEEVLRSAPLGRSNFERHCGLIVQQIGPPVLTPRVGKFNDLLNKDLETAPLGRGSAGLIAFQGLKTMKRIDNGGNPSTWELPFPALAPCRSHLCRKNVVVFPRT